MGYSTRWFNTLSHTTVGWKQQPIASLILVIVAPTGFGWLGNKGQIKEENGTYLWITARMLHVYSVAAAMGRPGAYSLVDHGIKAMNGALRDKKVWRLVCRANDEGVVDASKQGYQHFFALLVLPAPSLPVIRKRASCSITPLKLSRNTSGAKKSRCAGVGTKPFSKTEEYRGGNANMHAVEAFLIVYDVTHDKKWLDRAIRVASVIYRL